MYVNFPNLYSKKKRGWGGGDIKSFSSGVGYEDCTTFWKWKYDMCQFFEGLIFPFLISASLWLTKISTCIIFFNTMTILADESDE